MCLGDAALGNLGVQPIEQDSTRHWILDAIEQLTKHPHACWGRAARQTRVHAPVQHINT